MNKICRKLGLGAVRGQRGFSLVEMLVAIAIFAIFTGILITSYMSLVKSLRGAEEYRILYSEARHVFDVVTENARAGTIFSDEVEGFESSLQKSLAFYSADGLSQVTFEYKDDELLMIEESRADVEAEFGDRTEKELYSDEVRVTDFKFYVWPLKNPFYGVGDDLSNLFHPKVTFVAVFEKDNPKGGVFELDLQTTVSLRTYN